MQDFIPPSEFEGHTLPVAPLPYDPPTWIEECLSALAYAEHLVLWGNTTDIYPVETDDGLGFVTLSEALGRTLRKRGIRAILSYDQTKAALVLVSFSGTKDQLQKIRATFITPITNLTDLAKVQAQVAFFSDFPIALMLDHASQLHGATPTELTDFFVTVDVASRKGRTFERARRKNPTIWVSDHPASLPDWFIVGNAAVHEVHLELPNVEDRFAYAHYLCGNLGQGENLDKAENAQFLREFAFQCDGDMLQAMSSIMSIVQVEDLGLGRISEAIRTYRTGSRRNPWASPLLRERVRHARETLGNRIKGQSYAIEKTIDVLTRSIVGLSSLQSGARHVRPRGTLFCVGPTGVGKTELAKSVTELLFGEELACHRFDMSEFMEETSITRLIGAPPGHPGHDRGGELVNALHRRPFSVFLFDEIEKAHPRVLDLFLQILDDGRLTDSRGVTGYFSEALIIFTSNVGVASGSREDNGGMIVLPSDSHQELEAKVLRGVQEHFRVVLKRPELLNRLGQNIVVFDYLRPAAVREIFEALVARILDTISTDHGVQVTLSDQALARLREICIQDHLEGGRGIANRIETHLLNPLARKMFDIGPNRATLRVEDVCEDHGSTILLLDEEEGAEPLSPQRTSGLLNAEKYVRPRRVAVPRDRHDPRGGL